MEPDRPRAHGLAAGGFLAIVVVGTAAQLRAQDGAATPPLPPLTPLRWSNGAYRAELQFLPQLLRTKYHLRLGTASLAGDDLVPSETGVLGYHAGFGGRLAVSGPDPLLGGELTAALAASQCTVHGHADLATPHAFGGQIVTQIDTSAQLTVYDLELGHRLPLGEDWQLQAGIALENRIFDADFGTDVGPTNLDLNGTSLIPGLQLLWQPDPFWHLEAEVAGFFVAQIDRDRDRLEDTQQVGLGVEWQGERFTGGLHWAMTEVDLVQDKGAASESFLHSRLGTLTLTIGLRF